MQHDIEHLVRQSIRGDEEALEQALLSVKDLIYNLSLRMLLFPEDAEDATQEILIRVVSRLSTFKGQSKFTTWVYRVASNYLLDVKGKKSREFAMDFQDYATFIDSGQSDEVRTARNHGELLLLEEEVKVSCTQGLLLCLDTSHRLVYILGDVLELSSEEGARVLSITPDNFRQQLARSRKKVRNFLQKKCGLVDSKNPCRCIRKIDFLAEQKLVKPSSLRFATLKQRSIDLLRAMTELQKETVIHRSNPDFDAPEIISQKIKKIVSHVR